MIDTKVKLAEVIHVMASIQGIEESMGEVRYSVNILIGDQPHKIFVTEKDLVKAIVRYPERIVEESGHYIQSHPGQLGN